MPRLRTKQELADLARAFATIYKLVEYRDTLYMPVDCVTLEPKPSDPERTVWIALTSRDIRDIANAGSNILFANDGEERSYRLMVRQFSRTVRSTKGILIRTSSDELRVLNGKGQLKKPKGTFIPNYLNVPYDASTPLATELFKTISEWVGSEEQAHSLLYHLSTALQTEWSAVKYVLLIGEGRNGKGTLLKMLYDLIGKLNISNITRQDMAAKSPIITQLNGKLMNIVFDGPKDFLRDSSIEKTIVAGELVQVEMKYENVPAEVQTNALFAEALNTEPNTSDKSPALQKRLARFYFPNVYPLDHGFESKMRAPEMLAALLHLMITHWVNKDEVAAKLQLTAESLDLQLQAVWNVSPLLRFLEHAIQRDPQFGHSLQQGKMEVATFLTAYRPWLESNGYKNQEDDFLLRQMKSHFNVDRKTIRVSNKPTTRRVITQILPDTLNAINMLLQNPRDSETRMDKAITDTQD